MLPLEFMMLKVCHRSLVRVCTLPETHPLHKVVCNYHATYTKKYHTPLHNLSLQFLEVNLNKPEDITPNTHTPSYVNMYFTTEIAHDKEAIRIE
jgi:hypothetical protein